MKYSVIFFLSLLFSCKKEVKHVTPPINKNIEVVTPISEQIPNTLPTEVKYPTWLTDIYEIDDEYSQYKITNFKTLNDSITYCVYDQFDGVCLVQSLATQLNKEELDIIEIGNECDHEQSIPNYTWMGYQFENDKSLTITEYTQSVHDSVIGPDGHILDKYSLEELKTKVDSSKTIVKINNLGKILISINPKTFYVDQDEVGEYKPLLNNIEIKDTLDYSPEFIKELNNSDIKYVSLVDDMFIIENRDTIYFPEHPKMNQRITLTGKKDNLAIALTVNRINFTTINYRLEMVEFGKANFRVTGQASISPQFYLGSESDESSISGISYFSDLYSDTNNSCYTYIRLGKEEDSGKYLLGKLIKNCNNKIRNIDLDNFPSLVEK